MNAQYRGNRGDGSYSHDGNWYDPAGICVGGAPCDNVGHGTHTMGTMVGNDGGSNQIGVAPGAKWISCKGCEKNSCSSSSLIACAQWVLAPGSGQAVPDVVNNSWGGGGGDAWYQSYVQNWVAAGIFPAFSTGNSGPSCTTSGSPGDYPDSYSSGATDINDGIASFSSRGPSLFGNIIKPNISAPGVSDGDTITIDIVNPAIPNAPSNLTASVSGSNVTLGWQDNSGNEDGFVVERKQKGNNVWTLAQTLAANVTSATDTAPSRGNWDYRVRAFKGSVRSDPSNVVTAHIR